MVQVSPTCLGCLRLPVSFDYTFFFSDAFSSYRDQLVNAVPPTD